MSGGTLILNIIGQRFFCVYVVAGRFCFDIFLSPACTSFFFSLSLVGGSIQTPVLFQRTVKQNKTKTKTKNSYIKCTMCLVTLSIYIY